MAAYQTVTLTGTYQTPDGTPHKGHIEIIPSERVIKDTTGDIILTGRVKVELDAQGAFSVVLPATDDDTLNPTGFGYTIAAKLHSSHPPAVSFSLPAALGATTVEDLTPVDPSTFAPTTTYAESSEVAALDSRVTAVESDITTKADAADVPATPADLGAEPAGLSQGTLDTLDATYVPHVTALEFDAGVFTAGGGTPSLSSNNGVYSHWLLDGAATESVVVCGGLFPSHWTTYDVDIIWSNRSPATGNIVFRFDRMAAGDGDSIANGAYVIGPQVVATAPPTDVQATTTVLSGITAPTTGKRVYIRPTRIGGHANDTHSGDIALIRVVFRKAT